MVVFFFPCIMKLISSENHASKLLSIIKNVNPSEQVSLSMLNYLFFKKEGVKNSKNYHW